jgi:RND family efflux transporter MFP subunit
MRRHKKSAGLWTAVLLISLVTVGFFFTFGREAAQAEAPAANAGAPPPPPVSVAVPVKKEVKEWDSFTGRFEAKEKVEVRSRVSGYLEKVHFKDGDIVEKGAVLFTIDPRPFDASVREAEAALKSAENRRALANTEFARAQKLNEQGFASKQILDQRRESKQTSSADVEAAKARLEQAKLDREYATIKAPITGRISRTLIDEGNLVTGGTQGASVLTNIVSLNPIYFYFDVDEQTYLKYARLAASGERPSSRQNPNPVHVELADSQTYDYIGYMDFVDNALNESSGTMRGRAVFENPNYTLVPGMFGRARILGSGSYNAILIPDEAVGSDQSRNFVYVVGDKNMITTKNITLGPMIEGLRVVRSGLKGDEKVVINGVQMLRDGMPVTPEMKTITAKPDAMGSGKAVNTQDPNAAAIDPQTMMPQGEQVIEEASSTPPVADPDPAANAPQDTVPTAAPEQAAPKTGE